MNNKIILSILLFIGCSSLLRAQSAFESEDASEKKFYVKIHGGFAAFTPGSYRVETRTTYPYQAIVPNSNPPVAVTRDTTIVSLGKKGMGGGTRLGGGVGYIINNFLNVGVDVEYFKGTTLKATKSNERYPNYGTSTLDYSVMTINPHVIFKAKSSSNYYIYNRLGILLSLPFELNFVNRDSSSSGPTTLVTNVTSPAPPTQRTTISNYKNIRTTTGQYAIPLSFGLNVALGVQFRVAGNLRAFVETFANFTVLRPSTYVEEYKNVSTTTTNTIVRNAANAVISNTTAVNINTQNVKYNYAFQKEGGASTTYKPGTQVSSPPIVNGSTTTYNYVNTYSYDQSLSNISRNMNAIGLNIGIAYRF